jgi:hypothetical protein
MGAGGRRYNYPKWVWTPAGGWWGHERVKNGPRNTIIYMGFVAGFCYWLANYADAHSKEYRTPRYLPLQTVDGAGHGHGHGHGHAHKSHGHGHGHGHHDSHDDEE